MTMIIIIIAVLFCKTVPQGILCYRKVYYAICCTIIKMQIQVPFCKKSSDSFFLFAAYFLIVRKKCYVVDSHDFAAIKVQISTELFKATLHIIIIVMMIIIVVLIFNGKCFGDLVQIQRKAATSSTKLRVIPQIKCTSIPRMWKMYLFV